MKEHGQEALGRTIVGSGGRRYTIVGIVGDILKSHNQGTEYRDPPPAYVIPGTKLGLPSIMVRVRPGLNREAVLADLRRTIAPLAPRTPVAATWWTDSIRALSDYSNPRFQTIVLGGFSLLAMVLTGIGIFAVMSFLVSSRTREIGIRIAIGAEPRALVGQMVRHALVPAAVGLAGGLLATRWLAGFAEAQLFKVDTREPLTLLVAAATVLTAAVLAAYIPARQAARVDPIIALRTE